MFKLFFQATLILFFASTSFAQENEALNEAPAAAPANENANAESVDQFDKYLMKGYNIGLEFSAMGADSHVKVQDVSTGNTFDYSNNTDSRAGALGISFNYAHLPRARAGYMFGLGVITKIQNDTSDTNSLKASKRFTQIRPEGNVGFGLSNGIWGSVGGHLSILTGGDITDHYSSVGVGLQATAGYVFSRNFGMDLAYYVSVHPLNQRGIDEIEATGVSVERDKSYLQLSQARVRAVYFF